MNFIAIYLILNIIFSFSTQLPHFIFEGVESFHECLNKKEKISFTIYGSLIGNTDLSKIKIENYTIGDIQIFNCSFTLNEKSINEKKSIK